MATSHGKEMGEIMLKQVFWVPGIPKPGGSKRVFLNRKTGKPIVTDAAGKGNKEWRAQVAYMASKVFLTPMLGPLELTIDFRFLRPLGHYGSGKNLGLVKVSAPPFPEVRPDLTKLIRSTEDALTGIAWRDDAQVVRQHVNKDYGATPGAWITVSEMERKER